MVKEKQSSQKSSMEAQLLGTISRVYGILRLEAEKDTMLNRWEAVDNWCGRHPNGVRVIDVDEDKVLMHD